MDTQATVRGRRSGRSPRRYNRALVSCGGGLPGALLDIGPEVCLGGIQRHATLKVLPLLNDFRLSEVSVTVGEVLDR